MISSYPAGPVSRSWSIRVIGWERDKDTVLSLPATDIKELEDAIIFLEQSDILGRMDLARFDPEGLEAVAHNPMLKWHLRTHAGSDKERYEWLERIRWRPDPPSPAELKAWRKRIGLTQIAVATLLEVAHRTYQSWEGGENEPPSAIWRQMRDLEEDLMPPQGPIR